MFGTALAPAGGCPPPAMAEPAAAKRLLFDVVQRGMEEGSFAVPPEGLDTAVLSAWALVHGLTLLLLDGRAGEETGPPTGPAAERIAGQVAQLLLDGVSAERG